MVLPVQPFGENDKMKEYPGSITISPNVLEMFYTDICRSLHRNGTRKVIFLNGHGGNRETLIGTGRNVRDLGMLIAIVEWWTIGKTLMPDLFPEPGGVYISELAVGIAVHGTDVADLRGGGYKGEWGSNPTLRRLFGEKIKPLGFNDFEYEGARVIIPVDAWDVDVESPPDVDPTAVETLRRRGEETIERLAQYVSEFAREFQKIDVPRALKKP
jgi:hypothetical protein